MQEGCCAIDTWDALKRELRLEFFPKNVEILAQRKLCELKHTGRLKPWTKTKLYKQRVQDLKSAYAAAEWLFDLISDSQDVRPHQSSSPGRNRNTCSSSPKAVGGDKRPEARRLRLRWEKDSGRMKVVNSVVLPIIGLVKQTMIKLEGWKGSVDFVVVKMDDFDVVLGMEFLLEQVIPMPSARCLVITGSFPTVVQADIRQPNGFKMISAMQLDKNHAQEEPPSVKIPLGALGKMEETIPKDTLCVPEKGKSAYEECLSHDATELSCTSKTVEEIVREKHFTKSNIRPRHCRVKATKVEGLEATCVTGLRAYEFPMAPFNLTNNAKGGKYCSMQRQKNVLGHVMGFHQIVVGKRKIAITLDGRIPKSIKELRSYPGLADSNRQFAAFNGLKQATIEGPSLGVADTTKPPKVEAEQFNCMLKEYLHHFVDGRQKNWVQLLYVAQFGNSAQTDSLIKRSQFEIKDSRHSVLLPLTDGPYVGNNPQVHIVEKEWEQMPENTRVCLEEASRPMEERVDQKRCPIDFKWMTKLSIKDTTTSCDYLSTWNRKNIDELKKSLLTETSVAQSCLKGYDCDTPHVPETLLSDMDSDDLDDVPLARLLKKTTVLEDTAEMPTTLSVSIHYQESSSTEGVFVPTLGIHHTFNVQPGLSIHSPPSASHPSKPNVAHASVSGNVSTTPEGRTDVPSDENEPALRKSVVVLSVKYAILHKIGTFIYNQLLSHVGSFGVKIPIALPRFFSSLLLYLNAAVITASDAPVPNPKTSSLSYRIFQGSHVPDIDHDVHPSRNLHIFDTSD
ncbi:uncharacterized protein E6C27_scaffold274G005640 [Cucumis melo var. makuwa]|uniref:Asp_protease_2 domain-containing protein n=1 Tax=Cucumis melo var. makuwa TaxID=1194695 RepID=A0A5A7UXI8_CUCMM|nr:uncharacterized protein E6C27_scaffold274G005640 [Cucumis melo var. makuwa]